MTDEQFIKTLAQVYKKQLDKFQGTLMVNPLQYKKFIESVKFLKSLVDEMGGTIKEISINPKERHGFVIVEVNIIDIYGEKLKEFINMLNNVDVFGVDPSTNDSLIVGINVNDIYKQVE